MGAFRSQFNHHAPHPPRPLHVYSPLADLHLLSLTPTFTSYQRWKSDKTPKQHSHSSHNPLLRCSRCGYLHVCVSVCELQSSPEMNQVWLRHFRSRRQIYNVVESEHHSLFYSSSAPHTAQLWLYLRPFSGKEALDTINPTACANTQSNAVYGKPPILAVASL